MMAESVMVRPHARRRRTTLATAIGILAVATAALAQRGGYTPAPSGNARYDGRFTFARLKYPCMPGCTYYYGLPSWAHGYATAEDNLLKILDALTVIRPRLDNSVVMDLSDPDLFKYPVAYMTEASFWVLNDHDAAAFRAYLQKGGFVIFDDFRNDYRRGSGGWPNFESNMERILPGVQLVPLETSNPIFHVFFDIDSFDIVPQAYDGGRPEFYGIFEDNDPHKRLMAVVNFNTDISDFWEFTARGYYPVDLANEAYKLGVNYIVYGLTH